MKRQPPVRLPDNQERSIRPDGTVRSILATCLDGKKRRIFMSGTTLDESTAVARHPEGLQGSVNVRGLCVYGRVYRPAAKSEAYFIQNKSGINASEIVIDPKLEKTVLAKLKLA